MIGAHHALFGRPRGPHIEPQPLGLAGPLWSISGDQGTSWQYAAVDLSPYAGHTIRLYWRHTIWATDYVWKNDAQLDAVYFDGHSIDFNLGVNGFENAPGGNDVWPSDLTFSAIQSDDGANHWLLWNGTTPSSGTGNITQSRGNNYLYAETSSPTENYSSIWVRSFSTTLSNEPGNCEFYYGMDITGSSTLYFYVDVEAQP